MKPGQSRPQLLLENKRKRNKFHRRLGATVKNMANWNKRPFALIIFVSKDRSDRILSHSYFAWWCAFSGDVSFKIFVV